MILPIIIGAIAMFAVGAVWFTVLFGRLWSRLMNQRTEEMARTKAEGMTGKMVMMFVLNLISVIVIYYLLPQLLVFSYWEFLCSVFIIWCGFTLPSLINTYLWEGKSVTLVVINAGGSLIAFIAGSCAVYYLV